MRIAHRALGAGLTTAACAATVLAGAPSAQAAEVYTRPADGTIEITGRGFGHGRGMSQYGAMNAARQGRTWQQIVGHYYPGTTAAYLANPSVRVSIAGKVGSTLRVAPETGLVADDGAGQVVRLATTNWGVPLTSWEVARPAAGGTSTTTTLWFTTALGKRYALRSTDAGLWTIRPADGTVTALAPTLKPAAIYLGTATGRRTGTTITPVVTTSMENYVRQVVPFESPGSWPVAALAAQTVAARSYAAAALRRPRAATYDICDTQACQVFGGITAETANSRAAVAASAGTILTSAGVPALTEFGSSNGGQRVYGLKSYLPGTADAFEAGLAPTTNTWTTSVPVTRLEQAYPAIGTFRTLTVLTRDGKGYWGGRVLTLRLTGTKGYVDLTGDRFRSLVGGTALRSTYFLPTSA
ncbi:SpoIID/LytB domain-containing protein [Arsenicicoccus dermatophilus]|uniref:SpoIID/LytB domain-containing protein n=1 Tax=Arsenicicoccus dermatophilus TaxID=1076331 RepID=UPI003916DF81